MIKRHECNNQETKNQIDILENVSVKIALK